MAKSGNNPASFVTCLQRNFSDTDAPVVLADSMFAQIAVC